MKFVHQNVSLLDDGDKVAPRREWIEKHVEFGMQEDQSILDNKSPNTRMKKYIEEETNE